MVNFHERLSERTVYHRYFHYLKLEQRIAHERLARICFVDYDRQIVLVAERTNPSNGQREIVAVARLVRMLNPDEAEFAVVVADDFQNRGLGSELTRTLIQIGREEKIAKILASLLGNAYKFMRDPQNRDEVAQTIVETTGAPLDVARSMLSFYYEPDRGVMPKQAEISIAGVTKVIELLGETG